MDEHLKADARILLVRPDKIGDLILTLPALTALRRTYPQAFLGFLCRSYAAPILENHADLNVVLRCDEPGTSLGRMAEILKSHHFDASVHFYMDRRCEIAAWKAGIPLRVGPFSKWTALFLTRRVFQHRSRAEKHEAEYNLDLSGLLGAQVSAPDPTLYLTDAERETGRKIIAQTIGRAGANPVIIHPGSAGSVQNWPLTHFIELGRKLAGTGTPVLFTAGKGEEAITAKIMEVKEPGLFAIAAGSLSLRELMAVLSNAKIMISNSTGPLHIASALGRPTLSFYPHQPIVTSAKRWRPFGRANLHRVLSPDEPLAPMSSISVERALQAALERLDQP